MYRFYVEKGQIGKEAIEIQKADDLHHLVRVMRIKEGEEVLITDGEGAGYITEVMQVTKERVSLKIKRVLEKRDRKAQKIKIALACAVPKYAHFEEIVDKATQLGIDEIIPLLTERTFIKKEAFDKKMGRLGRIMRAAAKQSGALFLPHLRGGVYFNDFIKEVSAYDLCLLPNLSKRPLSIKEAVAAFAGGRLLVLIGPEGDFTPDEIRLALEKGCQGVSLGESVLRVDTAAVAVISFLKMFLSPPLAHAA
jgi:16S rRNA (uracil1498-N3)-methyltransferase